MRHTVVGLFDSRSDAQAAMDELVDQGFILGDIDLSNRRFAQGNFAGGTSGGSDRDFGTNSSTATGAATDAAGDAAESFTDKVGNFFNSLFASDDTTARNYTNAASDAEAILTVQVDADDRARLAQEIMDRHDAIDVEERGAKFNTAQAGTATGRTTDTNAKTRIPVVEEKLNVGKQQVERGGARIRSRIVERPVEENVRLREEHVVVNRHPVDRDLTDADLKNFRPGEIEITEHAEVPVVGKQARVVEEVEVGKTVSERNETVKDTVRGTDVDVEKLDDKTANTKAHRAKP
jgi:uncharacterized protein (TIGR02271 family)